MSSSSSNGLTVRISGLPPETDANGNDVRRFFESGIGSSGSVISEQGIGPVVFQAMRLTKQTTVTFLSADLKEQALKKCDKTAFSAENGNGAVTVDVEDDFIGLTTLYSSTTGPVNVE